MKLGIVGSRTFTDYELMKRSIDLSDVELIVSGGARGADSLAAKLALENSIPLIEFLPDYATHGRAAPFVRNTQIVESSDVIIAFWDGKSKGTMDSVKKAQKLGKMVQLVEFNRVNLEF